MGYGTSQRTKVHVVAVKREAYAKEKVKQIFLKNVCWGEGGRTEGGSGRACQDFLISSPAFGLSVTYIQYQHGKEKKNKHPIFAFSFVSSQPLCVSVSLNLAVCFSFFERTSVCERDSTHLIAHTLKFRYI